MAHEVGGCQQSEYFGGQVEYIYGKFFQNLADYYAAGEGASKCLKC